MEKSEDELLDMVRNIKFRRVRDDFQGKLKDDIKQINNSSKALTFADKTTNLYDLDKTQYDKLLHQTVTKTYKKAKKNISNIINEEAKDLATELDIEDRMESMAKQQAFISFKVSRFDPLAPIKTTVLLLPIEWKMPDFINNIE